MIRIHTTKIVPRYSDGVWKWNEKEDQLQFEKNTKEDVQAEYKKTSGFQFLLTFNQIQELVFREEFQRPESSFDEEVIITQDIKNLVLFKAPKEILYKKFFRFVQTATVDNLLHGLIMYFEHFLKVVEFVLIRRDEVSTEKARLQSETSSDIKRVFSNYLTQYRLLVAREYSKILLGEGDMKPFHHMRPIINLSRTISDQKLHEEFLAFAIQVVWIAMHRRDHDVIEAEISRLFRSEHFKLNRNDRFKFTTVEASMLYGPNYKRVNYRAQTSPLIQELKIIAKENYPILWIGTRKYRGTDLRMHQLELEYIVPDSQLRLVDVAHGILGHPKKVYDTNLDINWEAVRFQNYSKDYDPYLIFRQPFLKIPNIEGELWRKHAEQYDSYYNLIFHHEKLTNQMINKWIKRDQLIQHFATKGFIPDVWRKCEREVTAPREIPNVQQILEKFLKEKKKLRRN